MSLTETFSTRLAAAASALIMSAVIMAAAIAPATQTLTQTGMIA